MKPKQELINLYDETYNNILNFHEELFEASKFRNPILKELDGEFLKLKNNNQTKVENIKTIQQLIRKFTGSKYVYLNVKKKMFNAYVIPIYNGRFYKKVKHDIKSTDENTIEGSQYIDRIYITFGRTLINNSSHKQLTAILLHELGHAYLHKSHVMSFVKTITKVSTGIGTIVVSLLNGILIPLFLPLFLVSRTFSFLDHREEYNADNFALKYGYGDDFAKTMLLSHKYETNNKTKMKKIFDSLMYLLLPPEHPHSKNRIKNLNSTYLKKYQKIYPDIKNELTIIFKQLEKS